MGLAGRGDNLDKMSNSCMKIIKSTSLGGGGEGGVGGEHGGQANCLRVWEDPPTRGNPSLTYKIFKYIIVNLDYKILKVDLARGMKWYSIARGRAMNRYSIFSINVARNMNMTMAMKGLID